jgi:hypothetical protein
MMTTPEGQPQMGPTRVKWLDPRIGPEVDMFPDGTIRPLITAAQRLEDLQTARYIDVRNMVTISYKKQDGSPLMLYPDTLRANRSDVWGICVIHETAHGAVIDDGTAQRLMTNQAENPQTQQTTQGAMQMTQGPNNFQQNGMNGQHFQGAPAPGQQQGFVGGQQQAAPQAAAPNTQQQGVAGPADAAAASTGKRRRSAGSAVATPPPPPLNNSPDQQTQGFVPGQGAQMNQPNTGFQGNQGFQGGGQQGFQGNTQQGFQGGGAPQAGFQGAGPGQQAGFQGGGQQAGFGGGAPQGQAGFGGGQQAGFQGAAPVAAAAPAPAPAAAPVDLTPVLGSIEALAKSVFELKVLSTQLLAVAHHTYLTSPGLQGKTNAATLADFQQYLTTFTGPINP